MPKTKREKRNGYWSRYPERRRAAHRVWSWRRRGWLVQQPCWSCGNPDTEAHHPLAYDGIAAVLVLWLCVPCHNAAHGRVRRRRVLSRA